MKPKAKALLVQVEVPLLAELLLLPQLEKPRQPAKLPLKLELKDNFNNVI
jgi:hypothetical protein